MTARKTYFNTCKLTNVKLYLNSEFYSYDDLNLDFDKRRAAILYDMYVFVRLSIKSLVKEMNLISIKLLLRGYTLVTIDCSR